MLSITGIRPMVFRCRSLLSLMVIIALSSSCNTVAAFVMQFKAAHRFERFELGMMKSFDTLEETFPNTDVQDFEIMPHKPLGCSIEESLAEGQHVFVSKVTAGGAAEKAGVKVGDVIVGASGIFGEMEMVDGTGMEKILGLIRARPDDESLALKVVRGSEVMEGHEKILVDLCSQGDANEAESEKIVVEFLEAGYMADRLEAEPIELDCAIDDDDCMMDSLYNMWADELPQKKEEEPEVEVEKTAPKVKPWSSRSSPSGTYVRDPVTGQMQNIDD